MTSLQEIEAWIGAAVHALPAAGARPVSVQPPRRQSPPAEPFAEGTATDVPRPAGLPRRS